MFNQGERVSTPAGAGVVVYKRMAYPDYSKPEVYSVKLDCKSNNSSYTGSVFPAEQVSKV